MVTKYYDLSTDPYRQHWGDSFHFAQYRGEISRAEAMWNSHRRLAQLAGFREGMRLLDIGCGVGGPAADIAMITGALITGVNISPMQLQIARQKVTESQFARTQLVYVEGDAMSLSFDDASYDGAFSIEAICHTPDKVKVYGEVARVLREGAVFSGYDWFHIDEITADEYAQWIEPICKTCAIPELISLSDARAFLEKAGFTVESICNSTEHGDLTPNWEQMLASADANALVKEIRDAPGVRLLSDMREAIIRAANSGNFVIGYWKARRSGLPICHT